MKMFFLLLLFLSNDKEAVHAAQGCGSVVNNTLKSPGYPNSYPPDMDCSYTIPIPRNLTMTISFIDFELDNHPSCRWDHLEIINDGRMVSKYCGNRTGENIFLTGDQILITFHSDLLLQRRGFLIHFTAGPHLPPKIVDTAVRVESGSQVPCSAIGTFPIYIALIRNFTVLMNTTNTTSSKLYQEGNYTCVATSKHGTDVKHFVIKGGCGTVIASTLRSPGYPNDYPNITDCISSVPVPQGMVINITINELYLEDTISCDQDYLKITNEKSRVFGKYCGHKTGKTVLVSGNYALIKVHSNSRIQKRGFVISFTPAVPPCKKR